ncbi:MAG: hypothetical protein QOE93_947 [Actinomycetota bacterium]|nr:hypothetical protein [Actinomycetota bacterium]
MRVLAGPLAGRLAEVTGWGGVRGVEVLVPGGGDDAVDPAYLEVAAGAAVLQRSLVNLTVMEEPSMSTVLMHPVGGQEVVLRDLADPGPFPHPDGFRSARANGQTKVDARNWGLACLAALVDVGPANREAMVARWLTAPILERVLNEGLLPERVDRLCFVVTDQDPPRQDDTRAFGELLALWVAGMAHHRTRGVREVIDPVVLDRDPHLSDAVIDRVRAEAGRVVGRCKRVVVVQAGGTPGMAVGITFGMVLSRVGPVSQLYVSNNGPVSTVDFPALIRRASVYEAVGQFLERRQPGAAATALAATEPSGEAADLARVVDCIALVARRNLVEARAAKAALGPLAGLGQDGAAAHAALTALLGHRSPGDVSALLTLAAWDALEAQAGRDYDRLVSQLAAIDDNLAAQWFAALGVDPTSGAALKAYFPGHDWDRFRTCKEMESGVRARLVAGNNDLPLTAATEVLSCAGTKGGCGLGRHPAVSAGMKDLAESVSARRRWGPLRDLRNAGPLAHGLVPIDRKDLESALRDRRGKVRIGPDVAAWLGRTYMDVGLPLPGDAARQACEAVARRLRELP